MSKTVAPIRGGHGQFKVPLRPLALAMPTSVQAKQRRPHSLFNIRCIIATGNRQQWGRRSTLPAVHGRPNHSQCHKRQGAKASTRTNCQFIAAYTAGGEYAPINRFICRHPLELIWLHGQKIPLIHQVTESAKAPGTLAKFCQSG